MTAQLLLKEIRQHWLALFFLVGLVGLGFLFIVLYIFVTGQSGSPFDALRAFLIIFIPIASLVLSNRIVASEYRAKTQLFLEALPLSRLRLAMVKYALGLTIVLGVVWLALAILAILGARRENLDGAFFWMVAVRATAFAWSIYSFFFLTGFFGRYNIAIYLLLFVGFYFVDTQTDMELGRFGPFDLVNERFAYERYEWPLVPLLITVAMSVTFLTASLIMAQLREGSIAALLGERMSQREKMFISCTLVAMIFGVFVYDERKAKKPFDLQDAVEVNVDGVGIKIATGGGHEITEAERLAKRVATEVAELQRFLEMGDLPGIFIVKRRDLDADRFERAEIEEATGIVVRCNYSDPAWDEQRFVAWFVRELLVVASHGRVLSESNRCLLDGFGKYWVHRREAPSEAEDGRLELRAAAGAEQFGATDVSSWLRYRERVGSPVAEATAWSGLVVLDELRGPEATRAVLRQALRIDVSPDIRATLFDLSHTLSNLLQSQAGVSEQEFVRAWLGHLAKVRQQRQSELDALPKFRGTVAYTKLSETTRGISYQFESSPAPPHPRFSLIHCELPPFDREISEDELEYDEFDYETQRKGELPFTVDAGTRFFWTFAADVPALGCEMISGWVREEVP